MKKNLTLGLFYPFVSKVLFTYMILISRCVVYTSPFWNLHFFIWHEIEGIITQVTYLRCNLRTRQGFDKKSHDEVADYPINVTYQRASQCKFQLHTLSSTMERTDGTDWSERAGFFSIWNLVSKLWLVLRICSLLTKMFPLPLASN